MYVPPDKLRLTFLKLDGFRPGAAVLFCPRCDFQYLFECAPSCMSCPRCPSGTALNSATVTPDLVQSVRAA